MGPRVLVLGAGISGLTSAVCVQQACPRAQVQLVSEHFTPDTTADGSAGFWEPIYLGDKNTEEAMTWCDVTFRYMFDLTQSPIAGLVKAQKLSGYHFYKGYPVEHASWHKFVEGFRQLTKEEMKRYPFAESGTFHTTMSVDVSHYMKWLMERFKNQGGVTRQARVNTIEEVATECDILINCSATSSRHLFKDEKVFPTRGQVWKVHAPWIKHFYLVHEKGKHSAYILPGVDHVTVGGTAVANDWNTNSDPEEAARIWERALLIFPELRHATPLKSWAGLRPSRERIRLEPDTVSVHGRNVKVIHNYGHGGSGVTMHWGCALEVTRMVLESLGAEKDEIRRVISRL